MGGAHVVVQEYTRRVIRLVTAKNLQVRGVVGLMSKKRRMLREKVSGGKGPFLGVEAHQHTGSILDAIHGQNKRVHKEIE